MKYIITNKAFNIIKAMYSQASALSYEAKRLLPEAKEDYRKAKEFWDNADFALAEFHRPVHAFDYINELKTKAKSLRERAEKLKVGLNKLTWIPKEVIKEGKTFNFLEAEVTQKQYYWVMDMYKIYNI